MQISETFVKFGKFRVAPEKEVYGELRVAGKESSLYLRDDDIFHPQSPAGGCITGTLHDLTKVTLLQCLVLEGLGSGTRDDRRYYYAKLFPHYVLEGHRHITPTEESISRITFVFDDAAALFYDFDAFGSVIDSAPYIEQIVAANELKRSIPIGPEPRIVYFTGKREIIQSDTVLGRVLVRHNPGWSFGGPRGVRIDNVISVELEPCSPVTFEEAMTRMLRLLRFLELVTGRPQSLQELVVFITGDERPEPLKVHWSHRPVRAVDPLGDTRSPQPADLLLNPIHRKEEFIRVMCRWLVKDDERRDARQRFHTSFANQHEYSIDRLIGAANMFDILPKSAAPRDVELSDDLKAATCQCEKLFKGLPKSVERASVLSALRRVGKASLKHKMAHRAKYLVDVVSERFPDLDFVLGTAVECRNHYVHGTSSKIDYSADLNLVPFLVDTLEFVFGASELVEAGWDIRTYIERGTTMSHPYGAYWANYQTNVTTFKALMAKSRT